MTPGFVGAGASISCCRRREVDLPYALASLIRMSQSDLANFDPVFCGIAVKYAAVGSGAVFVLAILILLTVDSTGGRCPGWYAGSAVSLWVLVIFIIGPGVAVAVHHARHWDKLVRRIIHGRPEPAMSFPKTPFERINAQHETDEFRIQSDVCSDIRWMGILLRFAAVFDGWLLRELASAVVETTQPPTIEPQPPLSFASCVNRL